MLDIWLKNAIPEHMVDSETIKFWASVVFLRVKNQRTSLVLDARNDLVGLYIAIQTEKIFWIPFDDSYPPHGIVCFKNVFPILENEDGTLGVPEDLVEIALTRSMRIQFI